MRSLLVDVLACHMRHNSFCLHLGIVGSIGLRCRLLDETRSVGVQAMVQLCLSTCLFASKGRPAAACGKEERFPVLGRALPMAYRGLEKPTPIVRGGRVCRANGRTWNANARWDSVSYRAAPQRRLITGWRSRRPSSKSLEATVYSSWLLAIVASEWPDKEFSRSQKRSSLVIGVVSSQSRLGH